jgi:hypothetical protein
MAASMRRCPHCDLELVSFEATRDVAMDGWICWHCDLFFPADDEDKNERQRTS